MKLIQDITVEQYMKIKLISESYVEEPDKLSSELVKLIHGTLNVKKSTADETLEQLGQLLLAKHDFVNRFKFDGVEYGFIPSLEDMSVGEFVDIEEYSKGEIQLHKLLAILYRPITKKYGKMYDIEPYESASKTSDIMKNVSYKIGVGALLFFSLLKEHLLRDLAIYTKNQEMKVKTLQKKAVLQENSVGIQ